MKGSYLVLTQMKPSYTRGTSRLPVQSQRAAVTHCQQGVELRAGSNPPFPRSACTTGRGLAPRKDSASPELCMSAVQLFFRVRLERGED